MAARAMSTGTVSFGLVSIPVRIYSATNPSAGVSFNMLHAKDGSRLKQQYICAKDGEIVPRDQMIKGYEFAKDRYVTFTTDEIKALEEKATQAIEIAEFIPMDKIDPVFFDKPYYLGPDKGGAKAYSLLAEVMQRTGRVALARYAARGKGYLVLLRPHDKGLVMHQLLYADEVRSFADVPLEPVEVREQEVKLAMQLVDQITTESFRPDAYQDEVRKRIEDVIQKKVEGQEVSIAPEEAPGAQIIDLMEALKASLAAKPAAPSHTAAPAAPEAHPAHEAESGNGEARKPARRAGRASEERAKARSK
jgi:DNA end-binding protein Ku